MARSAAAKKKLDELRNYVDGVAKKLADDVYGPQGLPWGTRLSELEDMAVTLREAIGAKMMEIVLERQAAADPPTDYQNCPGCRREPRPNDAEPRSLDTDGGKIAWNEPHQYCPKCRRSFFPSVEKFGD
jgi:hypothetical protein